MYGTNKTDWESRKVFASGFIVKENCQYPSNWRSKGTLSDYLKKNNVVGLEGIDTRKLVKHIRTQGAMRGIISSTEFSISKSQKRTPGISRSCGQGHSKRCHGQKTLQLG